MPSLYYIRTSYEEIQCPIGESLPPHTSFIASINLLKPIGGQTILTVVDIFRGGTSWRWKPKYTYDFAPLISNFQKAVRLREVVSALATARQLLGQDHVAFLRRLPVVLLEDAMLQPHIYAQICWLMAATSKGYILMEDDVQLIMDAIVTALECDERYDLMAEVTVAADEKYWLTHEVDYTVRAAFVGIRMRALAGGMKFDAAFLERLARRLLGGLLPFHEEISTVDIDDLPEFSVSEHMLMAAIDFHCCRQLLEVVRLETGQKTSVAQNAIWWHRSSLNERKAPELVEILERAERFKTSQTWAAIARTVSGFAESFLRRLDGAKVRVEQVRTLDQWFKTTPQQ